MSQLKKSLFAAYNGFADKRIKNLSKSTTFIVDDRTQSDLAADKTLFLWFCSVFVDVITEQEELGSGLAIKHFASLGAGRVCLPVRCSALPSRRSSLR